MKITTILLTIIILVLFSTSTLAISGTSTAVWTYSEGNWSATHPGNMTADNNKTTYGQCNDDTCIVMMNFTLPGMGYYNSVNWLSNVSNNTQINNGEDAWSQQDCFTWTGNNMFEGMVTINNSANPNITYYCSVAPTRGLKSELTQPRQQSCGIMNSTGQTTNQP